MHAKEQTLQQILEGSKQYLIPLYQRTYSWKREQIQQLWDDLAAQAALVTSGDVGPGHFLGSLVLAPTSPVAGGVQRWLVVDGQQRLTTLSLMLAALRDHVRAEDEGAADRIHRQFLINEFAEQGERFKILPTQRDRPAFEAVIAGDPGEVEVTLTAAGPANRAPQEPFMCEQVWGGQRIGCLGLSAENGVSRAPK